MITYCAHCGADLSNRPTGAVFGHWDDRCPDCGLMADEHWAALAPGGDEVEYSLAEWSPADRSFLSGALADREVLWRWERGPLLVVDERDQPVVEEVLDDLEAADQASAADGAGGPAGPLPENELGGDDATDAAAQTAMADLFVVSDRLQHTPDNGPLLAELEQLATAVDGTPPPFGVERRSWNQMGELARSIVEAGAEGDEEAVAAGARALRGLLRDLV